MMRSHAAWLAIGMAAAACGGAPPPPPSPPAAPPAPPAVAAAPDLSEVPEPAHLIGILRWKNPEATLKTIYQWTGVRLGATDLLAEALDKNVASALATDAPIDVAVALDDRSGEPLTPLFAIAVGVRSLEGARSAAQGFGTVTEVSPGEYKVVLKHRKKKNDRPFCTLSAAVGPAPARFVCGQHEHDVETLRAYLNRTLPTRQLGDADLHLELRAPPVVDVYGPTIEHGLHLASAIGPSKLQIGEPTFDRAIERMTSGLADELGAVVQDLDALTLDLTMAPDKATASSSLHFRGQRSWTATTIAGEAGRAGPPPPMFWHLPASSTAAVYQFTPEARRFEAIRHVLSDLLEGWLQHEGLATADRSPIVALLGDKFVIDSPWVMASGPPAAEPTPKTTTKKPAPIPDPWQTAVTASGWHLVGIGAPNPSPDLLKSLAAASSRAGVQTFVRNKLASLASGDDAGSDAATWPSGLALKAATVPKELPKGSLAFELTITRPAATPDDAAKKAGAAKKRAATSVKVQMLVTPEATQTWIAIGGDKAQLVKLLLASAQTAPESGTLASRQDLAVLRQTKSVAASFSTLDAMLQSWSPSAAWMGGDAASGLGGARSMLGSTPNKGQTPIFSSSDVKTGDGTTWSVRVEVPKGVIEDAILVAASSGLSSLPRPGP